MTATLQVDALVRPRSSDETFRTHLMPHQVTAAVRQRMALELTYEQLTWTLLVVSTCLFFGVIVVVVFASRDLSSAMQHESLRPVMIAGLFALLVLHAHYRRQRKFVATAPVASALVLRVKEPLHFDEASSLAVPRLLLRYLPRSAEEAQLLNELHHSADAHMLWVELDGFSARFERTVHAGDLVSVLYEPTDPEHVRVVEFERGGPVGLETVPD